MVSLTFSFSDGTTLQPRSLPHLLVTGAWRLNLWHHFLPYSRRLSMRTALKTSLVCLLLAAAVAAQQTPVANPYSSFNKGYYARIKGILVASAEKMPEENYSFKPVDTVRSYGQLVGHVADAQYLFCSMALGEKNPAPNIEKTKTSK